MTTVTKSTLEAGFERAVDDALERGYARLTPSGMFGEHRQFTATELEEFLGLMERRLGIDRDLIQRTMKNPAGFEFNEWSDVMVAPGEPSLLLQGIRVCHNCYVDPDVLVDFSIKRC